MVIKSVQTLVLRLLKLNKPYMSLLYFGPMYFYLCVESIDPLKWASHIYKCAMENGLNKCGK